MMIRSPLSLAAAALTLTLVGCNSPVNPLKPSSSSQQAESGQSTIQHVEQILAKAEQAQPTEAARLKADAAIQLLELNRKQDAVRLLRQINTRLLPASMAFEIARLQAEDALTQSDPTQALSYLSTTSDGNLESEQALTISKLRAQAYNQQQDSINEVRELIRQSQLSPEDSPEVTQERIWAVLNSIPSDQISQLAEQDNNYQEQGWFELADSLNKASDLNQQNEALQRWGILWENHPANRTPPKAINNLNFSAGDINHLALLLPQSGKLSKPARAITEGFLSAYYRAQQGQAQVPKLTFLDSTKINSAQQLAATVQERGIDFVIGPLDKEKVQRFTSSLTYTTPMMALNYSESTLNNGSFQFGLSADDEARQVARQMWQDGHKHVAIITTAASWGQRASKAFEKELNELGGTVITQTQVKNNEEDFNAVVSKLVATDESKARSERMKQILKRKIETQERPRQDIDAFFFAIQPSPARQLKPTLAFNYVGNRPIYATSHVYSGTTDPISDADLANIRFLSMPWNIQGGSVHKRNLAILKRDTSSRFGGLYALGIDAFTLYPLLPQLAAQSGNTVSGLTGKLSIKDQGTINRELSWATFQEGQPLLLNQ